MEIINELEGKKFNRMGRAADLCWLSFGKLTKIKDYYGKEKEKGEFAVHLQCPWRLIERKTLKIVLASADIYEPCFGYDRVEEFEWDVPGNNLFDEKVQTLMENFKDTFIVQIDISSNNDICILFSNDYILESFVNVSAKSECWRAFKLKENTHLVVEGNNIELQ